MNHFPHEKLLRIHDMRLEVAFNAVRDEQAIVETHKQKCAALQQKLATLQSERERQQQGIVIGDSDTPGNGENLTAALLTLRELSICLYSDRLERVANELDDARRDLEKANDALAVELRSYHRVRVKRDRLKERKKGWQREALRSAARTEDQEMSEFELAQCTATR